MNERLTEEYVSSLEERIAGQRRELRLLHERLRDGDEGKLRANKHARRRIQKLERYLGVQAAKLADQHQGIEALKAVEPGEDATPAKGTAI